MTKFVLMTVAMLGCGGVEVSSDPVSLRDTDRAAVQAATTGTEVTPTEAVSTSPTPSVTTDVGVTSTDVTSVPAPVTATEPTPVAPVATPVTVPVTPVH